MRIYSAQYGVTIARGTERLKAVAANARQAEVLDVKAGTPTLQIERIALDVNGKPAEWRLSVCRTDETHYVSDLR